MTYAQPLGPIQMLSEIKAQLGFGRICQMGIFDWAKITYLVTTPHNSTLVFDLLYSSYAALVVSRFSFDILIPCWRCPRKQLLCCFRHLLEFACVRI